MHKHIALIGALLAILPVFIAPLFSNEHVHHLILMADFIFAVLSCGMSSSLFFQPRSIPTDATVIFTGAHFLYYLLSIVFNQPVYIFAARSIEVIGSLVCVNAFISRDRALY